MNRQAGQGTDESVALRIEVAGRPLGYVRRRLRVLPHGLDEVLAAGQPVLPPAGRDGWLLRSLPRARLAVLSDQAKGWLVAVRQEYPRHHIPMAGQGFDDWWLGFSSKTRSALSRKARRLADRLDGGFTVQSYRTSDEIAEFMAIAGLLSGRTYQARLMQAGLPTDQAGVAHAITAAALGNIRAFLLFAGGRPIAYLYLPVERDVLIYSHLGYDPDFADLSPGTVLHVEAMRALYDEGRFRAFDFTEGDGAHKAQFGRASVPCADVLILRPTLRNRAALAMMRGVDAMAARAATVLDRTGLRARAKALIRR
ncbi:GNAT family N-acetyltransferase [Sphingopyxis sp.]|uniref:GNAT family N-acetyltransferase n=1 Tax=Sphingopyxis sp. TaxID=1908224 RepID=UPI003D11BDC6